MDGTAKTTKKQREMRTNTLVPVSFGQHEDPLRDLWNEGCRKMCISRSAWVKQKIREEFGDEKLQGVS